MILRGFELADTYDIPWSIHLSETEQEVSECLEKHGKTPPAYLDSLGCLTPRSLLIHCCHLSDGEITLMAKRGCGVAHQPESNMKLASGTARAQSMLDAGVTVCLGTDGAASNNNLDMFGEMTTTALLQKSHLKEPTAMPAQSVLDMATRNGATCLMRPDLGRIEPGSAADFTALDLERPSLLPVYNPVSHAVYAATGGDVRLTMVAGRVLYRDGRFPTFDYPALVDEVRSIGRSIDRKKRT
jgi:5-methylthioadenosine/S-adenosylhomocysteine deaminase